VLIFVTDISRAIKFYGDVLGLRLSRVDHRALIVVAMAVIGIAVLLILTLMRGSVGTIGTGR